MITPCGCVSGFARPIFPKLQADFEAMFVRFANRFGERFVHGFVIVEIQIVALGHDGQGVGTVRGHVSDVIEIVGVGQRVRLPKPINQFRRAARRNRFDVLNGGRC